MPMSGAPSSLKKWAGMMLGCTLIAPQASAIVGGQADGPLEVLEDHDVIGFLG